MTWQVLRNGVSPRVRSNGRGLASRPIPTAPRIASPKNWGPLPRLARRGVQFTGVYLAGSLRSRAVECTRGPRSEWSTCERNGRRPSVPAGSPTEVRANSVFAALILFAVAGQNLRRILRSGDSCGPRNAGHSVCRSSRSHPRRRPPVMAEGFASHAPGAEPSSGQPTQST
jgi:hypothetical protein